jgi:ABC-type antimicrobial peptide transport system permease subunit
MMDRSLLEFRWLRRLLAATALLWLLWIAYATVDYFGYGNQLGMHVYYPFYIFFAVIIIWTAMVAFLKPQAGTIVQRSSVPKPLVPAELRQKGKWLRKAMETGLFYQDAELSLRSLAETLDLNPNELSRIINAAFAKSFNDFINEYRIREVIRKMQDPAYDRITLLGMAMDAGFNSKSTFNRVFRETTGKSPAEYKIRLEKERPSYTLRPYSPSIAIISSHETTAQWSDKKLNRKYMFKNYLKIAWRNLVKNKTSSFINIGGMAVGMAVVMLIDLWIWDELSYDKYHINYDSIGQLMTTQTSGGQTVTFGLTVVPLGNELRTKYGNSFKLIALTSGGTHVLAVGEKKIAQQGMWAEPDLPAMLSLVMVKGSYRTYKDPASMLLSAAAANALFGNADPINKVVRVDNNTNMKVTGVYQDLPDNTTLSGTMYLLPWSNPANSWSTQLTKWDNHGCQLYVQLNPNIDFNKASAQIKNITTPYNKTVNETIQIFPMSRWHLYSEFQNGVSVGGRIRFVRLFGIIGLFVLLLACINFMNLSTARSEKKAKEVGIRKAIGSLRSQLIGQFLSESMLIVFLAAVLTVILVWAAIPHFNNIAGKQLSMPWGVPLFWLSVLGFTFFTGLVSGSYPAFYLSRFKPVKALKGAFRPGRFAALPRKALVIVQFTVSIVLIIGTVVVYRQIQFAANRPVGYTREGLITVEMNTSQIYGHYAAMRNDLIETGAAMDMSESSNATTIIYAYNGGFTWDGKAPGFDPTFGDVFVSTDFGKTIGWKIIEGRDFSSSYPSDTGSFILNESALKVTGIKNPVGKIMHWNGKDHVITGIVEDMIMESPYKQTIATIFQMKPDWVKYITIRINPKMSTQMALNKIAAVFKKYDPASPFEYKFNDDEYAKKFSDEQQTAHLATVFAVLAIFISCLGLFGMASFIAEQRIKEIGVRKVMGATIFNLWHMLSKDFVVLVVISMSIAAPAAWYFMRIWLKGYQYRAEISWWIFALTALGAMLLTLATISYQSIAAAMANPVKSLRSE